MVVVAEMVEGTDGALDPSLPVGLIQTREGVLEDAREDFVRTRRIAPTVRHEIAMSWRRSMLAGVSPHETVPQRVADINFDCQLMRVAKPVLEEREIALEESGFGIVLTDADARVLARWGTDAKLDGDLIALNVIPGYCVAEWIVGTNSAALALETGQPAEVHGPEHFAAAYAEFSAAGAPIVHPLSRRLLGSLNVICRWQDSSRLLTPWLLEVVREIERRVRADGCVHEQLLLEAYLSAKRDSRRPLMCLNDQTILTNSAAARLLGAVDKALLWEQASHAINERADGVSTLMLSDGRRILAHCWPIYDGLTPVGARIEIELDGDRAAKSAKRRTVAPAGAPLAGLAGQSMRWQQFCEEALAVKDEASPLLFVGEPGSGKLAAVRALFDGEQVDVFDAALHEIESTKWLRRLSKRLDDSKGVVVLQHLDALEEATARTVGSLIAGAGATGPRIVGTMSRGDGTAIDQFDRVVKVPALRDRMDDMRELVQALSDRHAIADAKWQWMPDAIQTLSRVEWSSNIRSLESVIKQVVTGRAGAYVDARGLPESVRAAASRRPLSRLEQLEAVAITEALQHSRRNKLEAAQSLGIARSTLYRRMRALGIDLTEANY
jgi:transcriptional regulator of acetoin/glycerol metabolism